MEMLKGLLQPRPTPRQQLREWQGRLRSERRGLDRRVQEVRREENKVAKAIREAAKRNDMASAKTLAKELVRSRRAVNRLYENKAQISSVSMRLGGIIGIKRTADCLSKNAEVMKIINDLMKAPELALTMQQLSKEMVKAEVMEDMVNETVDSALDSEDVEDEIEEEVDKVLAALGAETASWLPVPAIQRIKKDSMSRVPEQGARIATDPKNN
ncbi:hypothetical protein C2845_PM03G07080 [Panicum miliaceum]|uniref:Vacuolar protein sorting-associated protein 24 homolog 1-like n=1 Tax=Panicum miliaceum TaxID=4540 RepID=A0A3L6TBK3_PANMI|nr:hypothetical protein C2845_PM03G07080 [Panicum miliaceum]